MVEQKDINGLPEAEKEKLIFELQQRLQESEENRVQLEQRLAIYQRWNKLHAKLLPTECRGEVINGICFDLLEADFAGCITTFTAGRKLSLEQIRYLIASREKLNTVIGDLHGYSGYYFRQLDLIGLLILEFEQRYSK